MTLIGGVHTFRKDLERATYYVSGTSAVVVGSYCSHLPMQIEAVVPDLPASVHSE